MLSKLNRAKFRVKINSLADEARTIRAEERRCIGQAQDYNRGSLRNHRKLVVGVEQRHTLLAYALSRGMPYSKLEKKCNTLVELKRVKRILHSLAELDLTIEQIDKWVAGEFTIAVSVAADCA